jgi:hypothetical protein
MSKANVSILQNIAIKILSQPCCAFACERNWSAFEVVHTKKRNHLEPTTLTDLVYVCMNMYMQKTSVEKEAKYSRPIVYDDIDAFAYSSIEEKIEEEETEDEEEGDPLFNGFFKQEG